MSTTTLTSPMTTIFTPPSRCQTSWTYEASMYNSQPNGILVQQLIRRSGDSGCLPSPFRAFGRAGTIMQMYSPGWCPVGYSTAQQGQNIGETTTAVCCPSGYAYTTTFSDINYGGSSQEFRGCTTSFPSGSLTVVPARSDDIALNTTTVGGPLLMWAQPLTIAYQQKDVHLFSGSRTASSTTAESTSSLATTSIPARPTYATATLSGGAIAGIAIGGIATLGAVIIIILLVLKQRKKSRPHNDGQALWDQRTFPPHGPPPIYEGAEKTTHQHWNPPSTMERQTNHVQEVNGFRSPVELG